MLLILTAPLETVNGIVLDMWFLKLLTLYSISLARARLSRSKERVWSNCILRFLQACHAYSRRDFAPRDCSLRDAAGLKMVEKNVQTIWWAELDRLHSDACTTSSGHKLNL